MLVLSHGNKYTLTYNVKNSDGSDKDLSGTLELKYSISRKKQTPPLVEYTLPSSNLSIIDSKVIVKIQSGTLNALPEGAYYHELWQINALGDPTTLMSEKFNISSKLIKE